jgi:hypothetical protein
MLFSMFGLFPARKLIGILDVFLGNISEREIEL